MDPGSAPPTYLDPGAMATSHAWGRRSRSAGQCCSSRDSWAEDAKVTASRGVWKARMKESYRGRVQGG